LPIQPFFGRATKKQNRVGQENSLTHLQQTEEIIYRVGENARENAVENDYI